MTEESAYSPFVGLRQCPLSFEEPSVLSRLPNCGMYCIMYSSLKPKDQKRPPEDHFASPSHLPVPAI